MKICLAGPSGTGKTTLCHWINKEFGIPFVPTSTKGLWDKWKIKCHEDIIKKSAADHKWGYEWQLDVLRHRAVELSKHSEFITDRSPLCNAVYFLMQAAPFLSYAETLDYLEKCKRLLDTVDGVIFIPFNRDMGLENDGYRVNNIIYQECSQLYFDYTLYRYMQPKRFKRITSTNFENRKTAVREWLAKL